MKKFILFLMIMVLAIGFATSIKAEDRYTYETITVVADTADRILTKFVIGAAGDSSTAFKIYFSDQGNT